MDYLQMELYEVLVIKLIMFVIGLYVCYRLWVGDPVSRTWKKWIQYIFKVLSILFFLMGIYVIQGPIRDVIDFKPIQKVITVEDAGSSYKTALFFTIVRDTNDESYYLFEGRKFSRGQELKIIYAPHSKHILYYERIPKE